MRELNSEWDNLNILNDIGVDENTISLLATRIRAMNAERPANQQKSPDEMRGEKLLECIASYQRPVWNLGTSHTLESTPS